MAPAISIHMIKYKVPGVVVVFMWTVMSSTAECSVWVGVGYEWQPVMACSYSIYALHSCFEQFSFVPKLLKCSSYSSSGQFIPQLPLPMAYCDRLDRHISLEIQVDCGQICNVVNGDSWIWLEITSINGSLRSSHFGLNMQPRWLRLSSRIWRI